MARYMCHNCGDLLLKTTTSVLDHVWAQHKIEVAKVWRKVMKADDARLPPHKTRSRKISGFRCEDCKISLSNVTSFLAHLDKVHGIHIWYEKGLTKRRVFFDGIFDETPLTDKTEKELVPISKVSIPLSQRPHKLKKAHIPAPVENTKKGKRKSTAWQELIRKHVKKKPTLNDYS